MSIGNLNLKGVWVTRTWSFLNLKLYLEKASVQNNETKVTCVYENEKQIVLLLMLRGL